MLGVDTPWELDSVLNHEAGVDDALQKARENLWLLGGGLKLAWAKQSLSQAGQDRQSILAGCMAAGEGQFDFVILDTSLVGTP